MRPMIIEGDVREVLKTLESESIQSVITSPPYWGLRDYGTATWKGGDEDCNHLGRPIHHRAGLNERTHGKKYKTDKQGAVKELYKRICQKCGAERVDKQVGLEESPEEYVKTMVGIFRELKRVLRDDGTVWLNLGDTYWNKGDKHSLLKPKDIVGIPFRVAFALQEDGWWLRQDIVWEKPNPMPEPAKDRCARNHEYIFLLTKSHKYYFDSDAIKEPLAESSIPRLKLNIDRQKGSVRRHGGDDSAYLHGKKEMDIVKAYGDPVKGRNKRSVWKIATQPFSEVHFATFPETLPETCIKASTKKGDTVMDIFAGSGTTLSVASRLGRKSIGIELSPEYIKILKKRCKIDSVDLSDFGL